MFCIDGFEGLITQAVLTEDWVLSVAWAFVSAAIHRTEMFSSEVRKYKDTLGLKWRFNLCRKACQRQINIQRKTYMQGHNAQTVAESCGVKCSLVCVCAWVCEVLADRVCQRNPWEICKTAGWSWDYCLTPTEQLATFFLPLSHKHWHRNGVYEHEYSRTSWGKKGKP